MNPSSSFASEFHQGLRDVLPINLATLPIGLLWGTLAVAKGLTPAEAVAMSAIVYGGTLQFVAIDQWKEPAPWLALTATALIVHTRLVLMSASLARHMRHIPKRLRAPILFWIADENWALCERRAAKQALTLGYYMGLAAPMYVIWTSTTAIGAFAGQALGDPVAYGFDFAFSALFIGILVGFWKGRQTAAVLAASAAAAALTKLAIPGAWFIVAGGLAGALVAALLHREGKAS